MYRIYVVGKVYKRRSKKDCSIEGTSGLLKCCLHKTDKLMYILFPFNAFSKSNKNKIQSTPLPPLIIQMCHYTIGKKPPKLLESIAVFLNKILLCLIAYFCIFALRLSEYNNVIYVLIFLLCNCCYKFV